MPSALVIEFNTSRTGAAIVTNNSHGNTVRSTFLAFAPAGWTCDVVESGTSNFGQVFIDWFASRADSYDLLICSNIVDIYYSRAFQPLVTTYSKPVFFSIANNPPTTNEGVYNQRANFIYTGGGIDSNTAASSLRIDTFAQATNLSLSNSVLTSFTNAVVAAKCANLVTAGLTPLQIAKAVRQQADNYPTWTAQNGFGKAPAGNYTVPVSYDLFPPQATEVYRGSSNSLQIFFLVPHGESPTALKVYRDGVLDATIPSASWSDTSAGNTLGSTAQKRASYTVVSDGGSFSFNFAFQYESGESQRFGWNEAVISGFTDNFEPPAPPEPEPEPEQPETPVVPEVPTESVSLVPKFTFTLSMPAFTFVKVGQISEARRGIGFMAIGSNFRVS